MATKEFDIIKQYFTKQAAQSSLVDVGVGDDAALFHLPLNAQCVTSVDSSVVGVHFPEQTVPYDIGWKSLAVSLSDIAAMGADPFACLLTLNLPEVDNQWLQQFSQGLFAVADQFGVDLIGGDTTRGSLAITTTVFGQVPQGRAILRTGARPGDDIYVTGVLGDAGLALQLLQAGGVAAEGLLLALNKPQPCVNEGLALRGIANAAIDVSDGLLADLGHILQQSAVGAELFLDRLPLSAELDKLELQKKWSLALTAGDDYQLCFCAASEHRDTLLSMEFPFTRIGQVTAVPGMLLRDQQGQEVSIDGLGFEHFSQ
ncbi:MAG: thiamine-phosphate kinase [Coxiellaceae bacterium]|nr:thiamine-phosphate kinase [Coxiellaceae bacterium]